MEAHICEQPRSIKQLLLCGLGWLSVALGVAGIPLPLLPTTPFLLLATWCFAQSSPAFHHWLITHPKLGPMVNPWREGKGLPKQVKIRIIITMITTMTISAVIVARLSASLVLFCTAVAVSYYILKQPDLIPENTPISD